MCLGIEQYDSIEVDIYAQIIIFYTKIKPAKRRTPSSTLEVLKCLLCFENDEKLFICSLKT